MQMIGDKMVRRQWDEENGEQDSGKPDPPAMRHGDGCARAQTDAERAEDKDEESSEYSYDPHYHLPGFCGTVSEDDEDLPDSEDNLPDGDKKPHAGGPHAYGWAGTRNDRGRQTKAAPKKKMTKEEKVALLGRARDYGDSLKEAKREKKKLAATQIKQEKKTQGGQKQIECIYLDGTAPEGGIFGQGHTTTIKDKK